MRLRFGKPSLPIMMVFAAILGALFYFYDNKQQNNVEPVSVAISQVATPVPTIVAEEPTQVATAMPSTQFTQSRRQEIPEDISLLAPSASIFSEVIQAYLDGASWDVSQLRSRVGHLEGTPWVTEPGNVVLSGHVELSDGSPGVFGWLENFEVGDIVTVESEGQSFFYIVTEIYTTTPSDLTPIMPTPEDRLTLITCGAYDLISNEYSERLIVVAERVNNDS